MTFEEFFKKKKIDLDQLKIAEHTLFAEFKTHYEQMGEKSFDHTKKYWFNQLRRKFHTPEEPKVEKVKIENPIAEQTINESLTEKADAPTVKVGFKPRFKAVPTSAPPSIENIELNEEPKESENIPAPKLGFKPKFKTNAASLPQDQPTDQEVKTEPAKAADLPPPKLGFKPKFKAGVTTAMPVENTPDSVDKNSEQTIIEDTPTSIIPIDNEEIESNKAETKPAYKPRFQMKNIKPKTDE